MGRWREPRRRRGESGRCARSGSVQQAVDDLLNVGPQELHPSRREGFGGQVAQPGVRGWVHEQHLPHHHLGDGAQRSQAHRGQMLGRGRAVRREAHIVEHGHHVRIARDHPGMQEGIPMHRVFGPEALVQGVRVGAHLGGEQAVETEGRVRLAHRGRSSRAGRHDSVLRFARRCGCRRTRSRGRASYGHPSRC